MKPEAIRKLPDEELLAEVEKRRSEIFKLRLRAGSDDVESPGALRRMRREVARFLTVLRERQIEEVKKNG